MSAVTFITALGKALTSMTLYAPGHPAREGAAAAAFERALEVVNDRPYADFSFVGRTVLIGEQPVEELRGHELAQRLITAGVERLEIDADVTREAFERALDDLSALLQGRPIPSGEARQLVQSPVRFGRLEVDADAAADDPHAPSAQALPDPVVVSLRAEASTVSWIHESVLTQEAIPMAEVEAVVGSLAMTMHAEQRLLLPLLALKRYDQYTTTHALNVSVLAMGLAETVGCSRAEIRAFGVAGLLHDIGKVRIPREILTKPGRLTDAERAVMNAHPVEGARILLERHRGLQLAAVVAYEHHVCIDGSGYPHLHDGRPCHLASRLVHICDIFDALTTERPYRRPWSPGQALAYLEQKRGSEVDADLVDAFARLVRGATLGQLAMSDEATFIGRPSQAVVVPPTR
jgi:putative nucleotidyltransferase with HDIG domain